MYIMNFNNYNRNDNKEENTTLNRIREMIEEEKINAVHYTRLSRKSLFQGEKEAFSNIAKKECQHIEKLQHIYKEMSGGFYFSKEQKITDSVDYFEGIGESISNKHKTIKNYISILSQTENKNFKIILSSILEEELSLLQDLEILNMEHIVRELNRCNLFIENYGLK